MRSNDSSEGREMRKSTGRPSTSHRVLFGRGRGRSPGEGGGARARPDRHHTLVIDVRDYGGAARGGRLEGGPVAEYAWARRRGARPDGARPGAVGAAARAPQWGAGWGCSRRWPPVPWSIWCGPFLLLIIRVGIRVGMPFRIRMAGRTSRSCRGRSADAKGRGAQRSLERAGPGARRQRHGRLPRRRRGHGSRQDGRRLAQDGRPRALAGRATHRRPSRVATEHLSTYAVPTSWFFVDELPAGVSGQVVKRSVGQRFSAGMAVAGSGPDEREGRP